MQTIEQVKQEIRTAQYRAAVQVNCELLRLYHSIGSVINAHKVWGSRFIENLAADIKLSFPEMKDIPSGISNIWRNLLRHIRQMNLCNSLLHKYHGDIMLCCSIRYQAAQSACGMRNAARKMAGRAMSSFIRSKVDYTSGRRWLKRYPILNCACRLHKASLRSRP